MQPTVTIHDVEAAAQRIAGTARRTPLAWVRAGALREG